MSRHVNFRNVRKRIPAKADCFVANFILLGPFKCWTYLHEYLSWTNICICIYEYIHIDIHEYICIYIFILFVEEW